MQCRQACLDTVAENRQRELNQFSQEEMGDIHRLRYRSITGQWHMGMFVCVWRRTCPWSLPTFGYLFNRAEAGSPTQWNEGAEQATRERLQLVLDCVQVTGNSWKRSLSITIVRILEPCCTYEITDITVWVLKCLCTVSLSNLYKLGQVYDQTQNKECLNYYDLGFKLVMISSC